MFADSCRDHMSTRTTIVRPSEKRHTHADRATEEKIRRGKTKNATPATVINEKTATATGTTNLPQILETLATKEKTQTVTMTPTTKRQPFVLVVVVSLSWVLLGCSVPFLMTANAFAPRPANHVLTKSSLQLTNDPSSSTPKECVFKFGGSSLANADRIDHVTNIIKEVSGTWNVLKHTLLLLDTPSLNIPSCSNCGTRTAVPGRSSVPPWEKPPIC
jgi:hypothetical protein